jgi:hypothetical protein
MGIKTPVRSLRRPRPSSLLSLQVISHQLWTQLQVTVCPFRGSEGNTNNIRDIQNLPFPPSLKMQSQTFYPLREVPARGRHFSFVDSLLTTTEVRNLKKEFKLLLLKMPTKLCISLNSS